ncbi:hypothetical protein [Klebsiella quasipneumoniae]|uniref:hypothetical protein n=1 Tax=Klebsiella quasipneumoniae TaxID=1463165 RepID=UPI002ACB189C|nr:hypothetical protein [Klebsiella quasipneumoniae]
MIAPHFTVAKDTVRNSLYDAYHIPLSKVKDIIFLAKFISTPFYTPLGLALRENKKGDSSLLKSPGIISLRAFIFHLAQRTRFAD